MKNNILISITILLLIVLLSGCNSVQTSTSQNVSYAKSADGSKIAYGVQGQGDITLIFVHCWTCNHNFWDKQIAYFSKQYKVVWLDLAGHGLSTSKRQHYTMESFGQDVVAVANKTGGSHFILVGHSMGGPVAVEAAKLLKEKAIGIVGVDTFYTPFNYPKLETEMDIFIAPFKADFKNSSEKMVRSMFTPKADPILINSIVKQLSIADQTMAVDAIYEIFRWTAKNVPSSLNQFAPILRNINGAPTGKEKALHPSVTMLPGVGHFVAQVKPDEFNQTLKKMINEFIAQ